MRVPFPAKRWLGVFFPYLSVMLLSPGPVWHHWEAHTVRPGAGGKVCEVCEREDGDWAELRQTAEVSLRFLFFWGSLFSRGPSASERSRVSVFVCVHLRFACLKRLFMKCLCGLMTTLGQNQACLWNTGLILQLQCALSSPPSLLSASMLHPLSFPPAPLPSPSRLQAPHLV